MIELVCDVDAKGPTHRIVSKTGNGLYHICYEVDNLEETMMKLRDEKFLLMHAPVPAAACNGKRIAWMYNRYVGLIELLEKFVKGIMFNVTYAEIQDILNKARIDHLPKLNISVLRNIMVESIIPYLKFRV